MLSSKVLDIIGKDLNDVTMINAHIKETCMSISKLDPVFCLAVAQDVMEILVENRKMIDNLGVEDDSFEVIQKFHDQLRKLMVTDMALTNKAIELLSKKEDEEE